MPWRRLVSLSLFVFGISAAVTYYLTKREAQQKILERFAISPSRSTIVTEGLLTLDGQSFQKTDLKGKWTLLTFGFSQCPDVCPTNLAFVDKELQALKADQNDFQIVFVGVDTLGDTPEAMTQFLAPYTFPIRGLIGKPESISRLANQFGAYVSLAKDDKGNIQVAHSPHVFLLNPQGDWVGLMSAPFANGELTGFVNALIHREQKLF